ncbi:expressed unknown protein [Seminavis robusta]|uniref:Uncharacterized protein n=1 Tax=Seminavis robusta TaxID=568900 RepID=A0A9N8EXC0_9STRA|nr:expressed unknown protein [Seminavis robusta]|eukprot:Sro2332_g323610.1 n/a (139) ;mRNA; r:3650-4066
MPRIMTRNNMMLAHSKPSMSGRRSSGTGSWNSYKGSAASARNGSLDTSGRRQSLDTSERRQSLDASEQRQSLDASSRSQVESLRVPSTSTADDATDDWGFFVDFAGGNDESPAERNFLNGFNPIHRSSKLQTISDSGF